MLMEPDEYTSQERALTDKAKELIEQHELDWGNGECFIQRDAGHSELYMTLEAPNHATVTVTVPAEADEKGLRRAMADGLLDFDPDEEFDECWSREFAARNGFTPSGFLSGLQEDKAYFGLRSEALLHPGQSNAGQGNETIAEIRWTEEDLRHWLKDHDWPDNNENMDAMRDMISARELRDRSIEEGWEIIGGLMDFHRMKGIERLTGSSDWDFYSWTVENYDDDLLDVCERENAADVLADLQAWWKTSQPDMRQHVDEMMAGIDAAMEPLDKRLYAAAEKEFKERALDPDGECYQLDGGTFISQESFDGICGDQRDRYMAWKNQAEPARLVSAWDDPARLDRLVGDAIDADDGGGCFYTDAQPIDYTQGMDYSPQQLAADSGLGDTVPLACESNASYSLAHHPDIKFTATGSPDGRKALEVSAPGSARHALITAKPGAFDVSLHDERGIVSGESFPYEANDSWTYRLSGQALRGALDLAVGWADPQETSPETAGLDLALDDGMETTHGR